MRARIVLIFATSVLAAGCGGSGEPEGSAREVVAAFYPLAFAAEQVDASADVRNLTPEGAEPHDLELTPRDVERVRDADLVLYLPGFMPALDDAIAGRDNTVDVLRGVETIDEGTPHDDAHSATHGGTHDGHETDAVDPHLWLDPLRYATVARRIADELGEPADASAFVRRLQELDRAFRTGLAKCETRAIVTSHAAFGYLADAYGLEQIALTGLSPESEPSAREIESLVAQVRARGATTVFFEPLVSPDLAETVAREAGTKTAVLDPLESLTANQSGAGADYFTVMHDNLDALRAALGCR